MTDSEAKDGRQAERRDSACAAALSLPSQEDEARSGRRSADGDDRGGRADVRRLSRRQRFVAAAASVLAVALIGVSAAALVAPTDSASLWETTREAQVSSVKGAADEAADAASSAAAAREAEADSEASAVADEAEAPAAEAGGVAADEEGMRADAGSGAAGTGAGAGSGAVPPTNAGAGEAGGGAPEVRETTVRMTVDSSNVGSPVSFDGTIALAGDDTSVYAALSQTGLALATQWNPVLGSLYVTSIGGLSEKYPGYATSGWKYFVNGSEPNVGCNAYILSDGDVVTWKYVLDASGR